MSNIKYGIQYENYDSTLVTNFGILMQTQNLVDVTLMCNTNSNHSDHSLRVHKVVLAASSLYFQEVLKNCTGDLLIILKINFVVLKSLVEYMYNGKTTILECDMDELISAAKFLKIKGLPELKEECVFLTTAAKAFQENLPEFTAPLIFKQPYGNTQENFQLNEGQRMMQESGIPYNVPHSKDPNNAVVRIPIEINSHIGNTEEIPRGRNKYKQHYYDRFNDTFPKNKSGRRKKHYNRQDYKSNVPDPRQLNRAIRKVLRKQEKSSLQTIQEMKNLHGQPIEEEEQLNLTEVVDSILSPHLNSDCEEFITNNEHNEENIEISEQQFSDDNHTWAIESPHKLESADMNSTLSEYVDVLKSTGLPTDVPILFELEDGSYVNISGEVLLNMVQSNSVQYEVVEHTADTQQFVQSGITKSIDQISEDIGGRGDASLEQTSNPDIMACLEENAHLMGDCEIQDNLHHDLQMGHYHL